MKPSRELLNEAIAFRVRHGHDTPGFTTGILRWQNPGRRRREDRQWRQGNQSDAWDSLGPAILAAVTGGYVGDDVDDVDDEGGDDVDDFNDE